MIALESLGTTQANLSALQAAMQTNLRFRPNETARSLLNNFRIAAQVGAAHATVAIQKADEDDAGQAVGFVMVRHEPESHTGTIRYLMVVPRSDSGVPKAVVDHAVETVWANPNNRFLEASIQIDQPGVREAFEAKGATCIERQEMRAPAPPSSDDPVSPPDGFRFAPWPTDDPAVIDAAARASVEAYRGTTDELLFAEVQTEAGMSKFIHDTFTNARSDGNFAESASRLAYAGEEIEGLILCSIREGDTGFVLDIGVKPDYRRRGLARALLTHALNELAKAGAARVQLWVTNSNPARQLYESLGFQTLRPVWIYVAQRT